MFYIIFGINIKLEGILEQWVVNNSRTENVCIRRWNLVFSRFSRPLLLESTDECNHEVKLSERGEFKWLSQESTNKERFASSQTFFL